ncbi:hypothetical protein [Rahnella victoriana]|uniref:hypothetical protein n=1 Tax=Rahnella victoriana TaxID=1510570 RepID=UPI0013FE3004|nr:hypothetical protein [Rahnella victoriana]
MSIDTSALSKWEWLSILLLVIVYGVFNIIPTTGWKSILAIFGIQISNLNALNIYGTSQLAKYVPGNIFHFAGRQALGMSAGIPAWILVKSTLWELGILASTGSLLSLLAISYILPVNLAVSIFLTATGLFVFNILLYKICGTHAVRAFLKYTAFITFTGISFYVVVMIVNVNAEFNIGDCFSISGAFIAAWLIGLITPGAPAGVGIREMVLLFILKDKIPEQDLIFSVLIGRVVTVGGDVIVFCIAMISKKFIKRELA